MPDFPSEPDKVEIPSGPERQVRFIGGATVDGAPIAYVIVLAAVIAALALIPFSVILSSGGSFPMSQVIYGLLGWVLGPLAGAIASGIGSLVGIFIAPYTAGPYPLIRIYGAVLASFAAGCMITDQKRKSWWIPIAILAIISLAAYITLAMRNGAYIQYILGGTFLDWSAIILFVLPSRTLIGRWISSKTGLPMVIGLFIGTWVAYGLSHVCQSAIIYSQQNWPEAVWKILIPTIPVETLVRCLIGSLIGAGVIAGIRAINFPLPVKGLF
jgi:hypothetical protein